MNTIYIEHEEFSNKPMVGYEHLLIIFDQDNKHPKKFKSGDFVKDWYNALTYYFLRSKHGEQEVRCSSTVDNFFVDGASLLFDRAWLIYDQEYKLTLVYTEEVDTDEFHIALYVPKGTKPTWEELTTYVKGK